MGTKSDTVFRFECTGQRHEVDFDPEKMTGDTLETLEMRLGENVYSWMTRIASAFHTGVRIRDMRTRDIIALVYLARAQVDPGITWDEVAKTTRPYTLRIVADEEPKRVDVPVADISAINPVQPPPQPVNPPQPTVNPLGVPQQQ